MIGGLYMNISIIGMPLFYGCDKPGVEQGPKILRENNVIDIFAKKHNVIDLGDISVPFLDAKKKFLINPKMKYLNEVIECNTSLAELVYLALNTFYLRRRSFTCFRFFSRH